MGRERGEEGGEEDDVASAVRRRSAGAGVVEAVVIVGEEGTGGRAPSCRRRAIGEFTPLGGQGGEEFTVDGSRLPVFVLLLTAHMVGSLKVNW